MNRKFSLVHALPFRRSSQGFLLGVCRGLAEHFHFSVIVTRVLGFFVLLGLGEAMEKIAFSVPVWSIGIYVLLAVAMQSPDPTAHHRQVGASRLQPVGAPGGVEVAAASRPLDLVALEQRLESLGRRVAKMENVVVTRERDWDRRLGT